MKISELIEQLQQCMKEFGNVEVMVENTDGEGRLDFVEVYGVSGQMNDAGKVEYLVIADETLFDTLMDSGED